jgi:hypothetical protein
MGPIERGSLCPRIPATTPMMFQKPTQHKPTKQLIFSYLDSPRKWGPTSIYMHCFMEKIVKRKKLSEPKSSTTNFLYGTSTIKTIYAIIYTGRICSLLASGAMIDVQMGKMSKLG